MKRKVYHVTIEGFYFYLISVNIYVCSFHQVLNILFSNALFSFLFFGMKYVEG